MGRANLAHLSRNSRINLQLEVNSSWLNKAGRLCRCEFVSSEAEPLHMILIYLPCLHTMKICFFPFIWWLKHNRYFVVSGEMSRTPKSIKWNKKEWQNKNTTSHNFEFNNLSLFCAFFSKAIFPFIDLELNPSSESQ